MLSEPERSPADDALTDALPLDDILNEETGDYDRRSAPTYLERTLNESPPYRELLHGDDFIASGCARTLGHEYLPLSPRTLRPTPNANADHRWTLAGGALWDHDNRARVEGPNSPIRRARDRRARARREAELVTAYVDRHRVDLEPFQLQVYGLFFLRLLQVAEIAARLRRSRAAVVQAVGRLRARAAAGAGGRPLRRTCTSR